MKQLLEIALKITGIVFIVPSILTLPTTLYVGLSMYQSTDSGIPWMLLASLIIYILVIYFLIFNTAKVVNLIYKEKEEEKEINFNFNRTNTIFLAVVLGALFGLISILPSYLIAFIKGVKENYSGGAGLNALATMFDDRQTSFYFFSNGIQIIVQLLILFNAMRITALIETYRKKQLKKITADTE